MAGTAAAPLASHGHHSRQVSRRVTEGRARHDGHHSAAGHGHHSAAGHAGPAGRCWGAEAAPAAGRKPPAPAVPRGGREAGGRDPSRHAARADRERRGRRGRNRRHARRTRGGGRTETAIGTALSGGPLLGPESGGPLLGPAAPRPGPAVPCREEGRGRAQWPVRAGQTRCRPVRARLGAGPGGPDSEPARAGQTRSLRGETSAWGSRAARQARSRRSLPSLPDHSLSLPPPPPPFFPPHLPSTLPSHLPPYLPTYLPTYLPN
jgi:hypothetical protein